MAQQIVKKLDHEFAANAKLSLEIPEGMEEVAGLKPLPPSVKYKAVKSAIEALKDDFNVDVSISETQYISTAVINFDEYRKSKNVKINEDAELDKIMDELVMHILTLTQKFIRKILSDKGLDFKEYYRTDAFFESARAGNSININWSRSKDEHD